MSHPPQGPGNGPSSAGMGMQHQQGSQGQAAPAQNNMSSQNLNQIVRLHFLAYPLSCLQSQMRLLKLGLRRNTINSRTSIYPGASLKTRSHGNNQAELSRFKLALPLGQFARLLLLNNT